MVSVFQDLKLKMERVVETNTLTHTQQEVSLGMHICLFKCMVYEVFVRKVLLEKVGF